MWFNILMVIFSGILAGSTAFYVFMTRKLWLATKDTAEKTRDAFRLSLALQLYQAIGFILGKGKRRDKAFFNALRSAFPSEYNYLTSMFLPLSPDIVEDNWSVWTPCYKKEENWKVENSKNLTISALDTDYQLDEYGAFSYECPSDKEIAWVEFHFHTKYNKNCFIATLKYEDPRDPGQFHKVWGWFKTEEHDGSERTDFDDGVTKLRFALQCHLGGRGQKNYYLKIYKITICLLPKTPK